MPSLQIRDLPPDVYEALAYRAERHGRSLAQQAIVELRRAHEAERSEHRRDVVEQIRRRLEHHGTNSAMPTPEDLIRADRER